MDRATDGEETRAGIVEIFLSRTYRELSSFSFGSPSRSSRDENLIRDRLIKSLTQRHTHTHTHRHISFRSQIKRHRDKGIYTYMYIPYCYITGNNETTLLFYSHAKNTRNLLTRRDPRLPEFRRIPEGADPLRIPRILVSETRRFSPASESQDQRDPSHPPPHPPLSPHAKERMRICDTCIRPLALFV